MGRHLGGMSCALDLGVWCRTYQQDAALITPGIALVFLQVLLLLQTEAGASAAMAAAGAGPCGGEGGCRQLGGHTCGSILHKASRM